LILCQAAYYKSRNLCRFVEIWYKNNILLCSWCGTHCFEPTP